MCNKKNEYVIYGLDNYVQAIDAIILELGVLDSEFDIKLILTEAISNAFYHGNKSIESLPITIRYMTLHELVVFEIEDCGKGNGITIPDAVCEEALFEENNRGLFLLNCYADKIEFHEGKLRVEKMLKAV